jgi:hypothetical protein
MHATQTKTGKFEEKTRVQNMTLFLAHKDPTTFQK